MDGTDFKIRQPTKFWKGWYSHKFNSAGLRYEVGIAIQSGDIVWVSGPFPPGKFPDLKIFRLGLKSILEAAGERAEADDGYKGEPMTIELPQEGCFYPDFEEQRLIKSKVRSRHETVNGHLKNFGCLSQRYRHKLYKHKFCFGAVSTIVQIGIISKELSIFQVKEYKTQTLYQMKM